MSIWESFITRMIAGAAAESVKAGKAKYSAYFVDTAIYQGYREAVDLALTEQGYGEVVVK